ncbi:putative NBD/HSP70 family sugar kinase [Enterococcus sp. PF1-24]|uniref:ROK family transcriptional regulator n=1 Tax=unclassified Enterococcus TaxID=2608891 RepID=UPI0024751904|nr:MULTISPECIES: ROK family transcriptional regulator [unclassified Enterococcus]MDH6365339.1 putative NBD/HSP70 family sugar kinase [Enterococcus sp. PFB1-1]MDH6402405.1 putative NBD/HSP70 family sugar kinase [Enterococcus sp. PF1-24]
MQDLNYMRRTPNESLCLEYIMNNQNLSRADLSALTGLTKATISVIVKKLIEDHLVIETGIGESSNVGGRKPIILQYNGKAGLSISIDVGYNYVNALLTYLDGEEVQFIQKKPITLNEATIKKYFSEIFSTFQQALPKTNYGVIGVVIAVHGPVYDGEIIFTPHYDLDQIPFRKIAEELSNYPVYLENEANLSALGEYMYTADSSSLISINMHSGIGAGIVQDGVLQVGSHGFAGEIGHQIVVINGEKCRCGNHGCLEMYAANKVCFEKFAKIKSMDYVNAIILREYYQNNDADALAVTQENVNYLSVGINNIIAHYDPEIIVLNSSLYREIPEMIQQLKTILQNRFSNKVSVRNSLLNEKATLLGGLVLNLQHFLDIKQLKLPQLDIKKASTT